VHTLRASATPSNPSSPQQVQSPDQQLAIQQQQMAVMQQLQKGALDPAKAMTQLSSLGGGSGYPLKDTFELAPSAKPPIELAPAHGPPVAVEHKWLDEGGGGSKPGAIGGNDGGGVA